MTDDLAPSHRARSHRPRPRRSGYSRNVLSPALALLVFSLASAASAQGHDGRWSLYAEGVFLSPKDDRAAATPSGGVPPAASYGLDGDGAGFGLGAEVRLTRRLGLEAGIASVDLDVRLRAGAAGGAVDQVESASFEIYLAGVDWHLTPERRLDVSLGGFVAMSKLDDAIFAAGPGSATKLTFDDDVGFGIAAGVEWPFAAESGWRLRGTLRYLQTVVEADSGQGDLDLDPLILTAGVVYRF